MWGKCKKVWVLFHAHKSADPIHNDFDTNTAVRRVKKRREHYFSADIGAEIEGGKDDALLSASYHAHALNQRFTVILKDYGAVGSTVIRTAIKVLCIEVFFVSIAYYRLPETGNQHA